MKVAKPDQDPRFDLPTLGLGTLQSLETAAAGVFAFEASQTIVLDRAELARRADACGVALVGVTGEGPSSTPAQDGTE